MTQASRTFAGQFLIEQALEAMTAAEKLVLSPELGTGILPALFFLCTLSFGQSPLNDTLNLWLHASTVFSL